MASNIVTRKEFLKKTMIGAMAIALFGKVSFNVADAAYVTDNLDGSGNHVGTTAPSNKKMTWVDTGNSGVMKYWDGSAWTPIRSTWDE